MKYKIIRFIGGEYVSKTSSGCSSCGSRSVPTTTRTTMETITWYIGKNHKKIQQFSVNTEYQMSEKDANILLKKKVINPYGQETPMFIEIGA